MGSKRAAVCAILSAVASLAVATSGGAAEQSLDLTARYILEIVKAFRTAYVLNVVERVRDAGVMPAEEWKDDSHRIPLPAQFVKGAASELENYEIGLIGLSPLNKDNYPKTPAEVDGLTRLLKNSDQKVISFVDGDQFKAISADLALVQSCVDCHNQHPKATARNFKRYDVMGGLIVRLKRDARPEGTPLTTEPPGLPVPKTPPPTSVPPWVPGGPLSPDPQPLKKN
jgi:hypothetical protein